jgi:methylenetetrahydrofolate dehydrogenase (NADP+)/methenyltetrahydrofolate cyclohydrolase
MPAHVLDGNLFATQIKSEVGEEVRQMVETGVRPGLAAVLVGENPASQTYVRSKVRACEQLGIFSELITPAESSTTEELIAIVEGLNQREDIDGILVQLPLPAHVDSKAVLLAVDPAKDVDGFHPVNVGNLSTQRPGLVPCTPSGCMEILRRANIPIEGQEAVIVGRSDIVGKPLAMLLTNANATVTICHSRTKDLPAVCRRGDILVAAIGRPGFITTEFVKPGATILDVGINHISDPADFERFFKGDEKREKQFAEKGSTIIGDCDPRVVRIAGAVTPVPGGVGKLTIAMLMSNTVKAARLRRGLPLTPAAEAPAAKTKPGKAKSAQ